MRAAPLATPSRLVKRATSTVATSGADRPSAVDRCRFGLERVARRRHGSVRRERVLLHGPSRLRESLGALLLLFLLLRAQSVTCMIEPKLIARFSVGPNRRLNRMGLVEKVG